MYALSTARLEKLQRSRRRAWTCTGKSARTSHCWRRSISNGSHATEQTAVAALLGELAELRGRVEALEAQRGVRDASERAVLPAIAAAIG